MPDKKRVLFAIGSMAGGGAERQTINYLRHLDRTRYDSVLYLHYRQGELLDQVPRDVPVSAFWDRHSVPRISLPGRIRAAQIRDLANVLETERIDVLCSVTFLVSLVAAASARRRRIPWLAVEMADPRLDFDNETKRFRWLKRRLLIAAYRQANRCIGVSDGVCEGLVQRYCVPREKLATVRNFLDLDEVDRRAAEAGPELPSGKFHLAAVGRLSVQKGHIYLLRAIDTLVHSRGRPEICIHLIGQGQLESEFRAFVQHRKLVDHVRFHGFLANPLSVIARCQLFCLPSLYEGLPLALLEAMACRVPVLATDCPSGPREVLDDGRCGHLVPPQDPDALADAIEDSLTRYATWQQMTGPARQRIESDYTAATQLPKLQKLIDSASDSGLLAKG
jgi:glycosyltransferase involved in cell wall biosynthesis